MTETTTPREMALALSIDEPGATLEEHLEGLLEIAGDLGLALTPDATVAEDAMTAVLEAYHAEYGPDAEDPDREALGDPDAAYEAYRDAQLGL
jgi:hypothetical protein